MWIYIGIFIGKMAQSVLSTFALRKIAKGEKLFAAMLATFESSLWLVVVSAVLGDIQNDPLKAVAYVLAVTCGILAGMFWEDKTATGLLRFEIVVDEALGIELAEKFYQAHYGLTVVPCSGFNGKKVLLDMKINRKDSKIVLDALKPYKDRVFVTTSTVNTVFFGKIGRRREI